MTSKILKLSLIVISTLVFSFSLAHAQEQTSTSAKTAITYPISELGNCASTKECKTYCDQLANVEACTNFAKSHGLISAEKASEALKLKGIKTGPGGCNSKDACKTYCEEATHANECAKFATDRKLLSNEDIQKYKKVSEAIKNKKTPGACHDQHTCETFCFERSHNEECLKFAKDNGLIEQKEADKVTKFNEAVTAGTTPGDCDSKDACEEFCADPTHRTECVEFAQKIGLIKPEEAKLRLENKILGPGGCDSKDACEEFCSKPDNQETCLKFAKEHNLMDAKEVERIETAATSIRQAPQNIPPAVRACFEQTLSPDAVTKIQQGSFAPDDSSATLIKECIIKAADPGQVPMPRPLNPPTMLPPKPEAFQPVVLPPAVKDCVLKLFGPETLARLQANEVPTAEMKDKIGKCLMETQTTAPKLPPPLPLPPTDSTLKTPTNTNPLLPPPLYPKYVQPKEPFYSDGYVRN